MRGASFGPIRKVFLAQLLKVIVGRAGQWGRLQSSKEPWFTLIWRPKVWGSYNRHTRKLQYWSTEQTTWNAHIFVTLYKTIATELRQKHAKNLQTNVAKKFNTWGVPTMLNSKLVQMLKAQEDSKRQKTRLPLEKNHVGFAIPCVFSFRLFCECVFLKSCADSDFLRLRYQLPTFCQYIFLKSYAASDFFALAFLASDFLHVCLFKIVCNFQLFALAFLASDFLPLLVRFLKSYATSDFLRLRFQLPTFCPYVFCFYKSYATSDFLRERKK